MTNRILWWGLLVLVVSVLTSARATASEGTGTLVFGVTSFETEVKIKKKVQKQLEHAGVEWGINGDTMVVTMISKRFVNADLPHLTRYGTSEEIELPAGTYHLTCVGYIHNSNSRDIDKVLSASAFFNEEVLTFEIHADKVTTLDVSPVIKKHSHSSFLIKVKTFMPDLTVKIIEDGSVISEAVVNQRTEQSVAWDDYSGPLKFEE